MANIDSTLNKASTRIIMDAANNRFLVSIPRPFPTSSQGEDRPLEGMVEFSELTVPERNQISAAVLIVINKLITRVGGTP